MTVKKNTVGLTISHKENERRRALVPQDNNFLIGKGVGRNWRSVRENVFYMNMCFVNEEDY